LVAFLAEQCETLGMDVEEFARRHLGQGTRGLETAALLAGRIREIKNCTPDYALRFAEAVVEEVLNTTDYCRVILFRYLPS